MPLEVKRCFQCEGYTGYYCHNCEQGLCFSCKIEHIASLDTRSHYVTLYREKFHTLLKQKRCGKDDLSYDKLCTKCDISVCVHCRTEYKNRRNEKKDIFIRIQSEFLLNARALSFSIKSDIKTDIHRCQDTFLTFPAEIATKKQKLEDFFENAQMQKQILDEYMIIVKQKLHEQKEKQTSRMTKHIAKIQQYKDKEVQIIGRPVKFLNFVKMIRFPEIKDTPCVAQRTYFSFRQTIDVEKITDFSLNITTGKLRKRKVKKKHLLGIRYPKSHLDSWVTGYDLDSCCHISCWKKGFVWVSDGRKLILTNHYGECFCEVVDALCSESGIHTLNIKSELIYIAEDLNINRLVYNGKLKCDRLIEREDCKWEPLSLFCSKASGEILVAMISKTSEACKVVIYSENGTCILQHESKDYKKPVFITENTNKDIVVSDAEYSAVVVSNREGRHRFSYKGHPPESRLDPRGICTDPLSNILVCTYGAVQLIDKDGQFLINIFWEPYMLKFEPISLSYEVERNVVWVGLDDAINTIIVYRHIDRKVALAGKFALRAAVLLLYLQSDNSNI